MKSTWLKFICAACLLVAIAPAARAAATNSVAGDKSKSAITNAPAAIPLAVFNLTLQPARDPFFPLSLRQPVPSTTNAAPAFSAGNFTLKGLSGPANLRLALINNRTVAVGESAEVTTPTGKIKIQCVEIKEASVVIRAASQPDELEIFLRKAAQ